MPFLLKLLITNIVIIGCARIGTRFPSLGGLVATMPLTSLLVLLWLRVDNPDNQQLLTAYTRGVLWGILPTVIFFIVLFACFKKEIALPVALAAAFASWLIGAAIHQLLLKS